MNKLTLNLYKAFDVLPNVMINGKMVKMKKVKKATYYQTVCEVDTNIAKIEIFKFQEITSKLWFLMYFLYFIISVGGIFDIPFNRKPLTVQSIYEVDLTQDSVVNISMENDMKNNIATKIVTDLTYRQGINTCSLDLKAKKRIKIYRILKILTWIGALATGVALIIVL